MSAATGTKARRKAAINGMSILIADARGHGITTTHEVLRDESDDYE